jgi:glutathione synthase/RimK-type ligase-like ATP-grasp enzyme
MILLWGLLEDDSTGLVHDALEKSGAKFFFLDHRRIFTSEVEFEAGLGSDIKGTLSDGQRSLNLAEIGAAYFRGYNFLDYEEMQGKGYDDPLALKATGFETQLIGYLNSSKALVLNRSEPSATNGSKPFQLKIIQNAGFHVPETLITNNPEAARDFIAAGDGTICKSISGVRSIVRKVTDAQIDSLADIQWCPTLFQKIVPGINYRAHVLDDQVFAVRIESDELDYRYGQTKMYPDTVPVEVAQKCISLNQKLGLGFSGIDLMRTPDDKWFCYEVNPSPAYSYFERGSGMQVSRAVAKFLVDADSGRRPS